MSEEDAVYQTEVEEAMQMLGTGYGNNEHAAIIQPPRTVRVLSDKGVDELKLWGWVKTSANFMKHLIILKGAKLSIWTCIALSIDETGESKIKIMQIVKHTGYSKQEVIRTIKELETMGYLGVNREGKGHIYSPEFVARGEGDPDDKSLKVTHLEMDGSTGSYLNRSTPAIEKSRSSIKSIKRVNTDKKLSKEEQSNIGKAKIQGFKEAYKHQVIFASLPGMLELADLCVKYFGFPSKNEAYKIQATCKNWLDNQVIPADIEKAKEITDTWGDRKPNSPHNAFSDKVKTCARERLVKGTQRSQPFNDFPIIENGKVQ